MGNGGTGGMRYRGMSNRVQGYGAYQQWGTGGMAGLPRVREKSGKNKIFSRSGNCQGILKKCQGILAI